MKIVAVLYPGGPTATETPELLGCAENALGLREMLESGGHELVSISDTGTGLESHLPTADVLIATPFWPAYITRERIEKAPNLVSVAEHVVMQILALVRNYFPSYHEVIGGGWDIGKVAARSHDLEDKTVGIVGFGRIGQRVAARLKPFDVGLRYFDYRRLATVEEQVLGARYSQLDPLIRESDVVSINIPLTPTTQGMFDREKLYNMKKGAYLVNTARGRIVDTEALVEVMEAGHLAGYAGDVWYPQPAPADHPWRTMPNHAMTPHVSGTSLEAQKRYSDGIRDCLVNFIAGTPIDRDYIIVEGGRVTSPSYSYAYES
jgi:formate dehydrogenase